MYTAEQSALLDAAKAECGATQQRVSVTLELPFLHLGKELVEERKLTYEFDARGIPCPMVWISPEGEVSMKMIRGFPGVYLASTDSNYQQAIENEERSRRNWKTRREAKDDKRLKRKRKK